MLENVRFVEPTVNLAVWCFKTLEEHGIHELKGAQTLKREYDVFSQLHVDTGEILLQKAGPDDDPVFRFKYKKGPYVYYSTMFMLDLK